MGRASQGSLVCRGGGSCHIPTGTGAGLPTARPGPLAADLLTSSDPGPALGHPELRGGTSERSLAACASPLWAATPQQREVPTGPRVYWHRRAPRNAPLGLPPTPLRTFILYLLPRGAKSNFFL